ncbi:hypothetical protein L7F22_068211 [Adiantum nelumboides]|nr:hypothetical protein [Adiantum nelumboides]
MASMSRDRNGKPNANVSNGSQPRRTRNGRNANPSNNVNNNNQANAARGQNINHLLAFTLPPRIHNPTSHSAPRRTRRGASAVPFNKERYVNAQYRFLVKPTGDYTAYFADSDIYLNWSDILTVLIPTTSALFTASHLSALESSSSSHAHGGTSETHEGASCPICLSRPTAPRMTKCGHVYCYPCILHYLSVHEAPAASGSSTPHSHIPGAAPRHTSTPSVTPNTSAGIANTITQKWKRCPVCWDAVYSRDLKAVQWWDPKARAQEFEQDVDRSADSTKPSRPTSDDYLCMRLIERPHLTTLALPQSSTWPTASTSTSDQPLIAQHSAPWHFQPDVMTFSKFMLASPDLLLNNLNSDLQELESERDLLQSFLTKDEIGLAFVGLAERKVHEQMEKVTNELDTQSVKSRIGYARKELTEHYEIEKGNRARDEEAMSRRQRKRIEREKKIDNSVETEKVESEAKDESSIPEQTEGTAEFLAIQAGSKAVQRTRKNLNPPAPSSSSFFFYQVSSGQNIFLHPLDIKVLLSAHGSYSAFPATLQVCVQGADEGSMNEEMRKRCKYLTHLSKGADIVFIEVDWEKMLRDAEANNEQTPISRSVLRMYDQALRQRRNKRRDRERREDRAKLRSEEQERASRPPMTTNTIPIGGFGAASRSPALSAVDAGAFGSSFGSQSMLSPSVQEALLNASEGDDNFPAASQAFAARRGSIEGLGIASNEGGESEEHTTATPHTTPLRHNKPVTTSKTVWGTPAAKGNSFSNALHNSSRAPAGQGEEDGPDWDAWLELEEDFIVGARNGTSVREGRGLNRQARKSPGRPNSTSIVSNPASSNNEAKETKVDESQIQTQANQEVVQEETVKPSPPQPPPPPQTKQQKKKKLVLTSGGGGRGTR